MGIKRSSDRVPSAGKAPRPRSLKALTKYARTVDDILAKSDVNEILEDVVAQKADIDEILVIYSRHGENCYHRRSNETNANILWMIKGAEYDLFNDEDDE